MNAIAPQPSAASINSATGEPIEQFAYLDAPARNAALDGAVAGFKVWREVPISDRAALLQRVATILRADPNRFARTLSLEMGK